MTAPVFVPTFPGGPCEGPRIQCDLAKDEHLSAELNMWPAEGELPEIHDISLAIGGTGCGSVELNAAAARDRAARLHHFADELTALAAQLEPLEANH